MKLFDFKCTNCGHIFERIVRDDEMPACPRCWMKTEKLPPVVRINMGVGPYGYYDETLGKFITTNRQHREEMQKQGVTPKVGEGWY